MQLSRVIYKTYAYDLKEKYRDDDGCGCESKTSDLCSISAFLDNVRKRACQSGGGGFDAEGLADALDRAELDTAATANLGWLHQSGDRL